MKIIRIFLIVLTIVCLLCTTIACGKKAENVMLNIEGMTDLQKAVVLTAESFFFRGNSAQYDMGYLYDKSFSGSMERRLVGVKAPEDYTAQNIGYTDCSGFVYDVYRTALNITIIDGVPWTKTYCEDMNNTILKEEPIEWDEKVDKEEKLKKFSNKLQPGDIMVYRNKSQTSGHAMLYVGNGMMIHSSGVGSFNYVYGKENYEEDGTYLYESIADTLLNPNHRCYLAEKSVYVIIRPLDSFQGDIPKSTITRMNEMRGIKAEKLASCSYGQTVNANEKVTFTFRLKNHSNIDKTLIITDTVPKNTKYLSGAQKKKGNKLEWAVCVPAGKTVEASYEVKVLSDVWGKKISSESSVCGIKVNCPEILVAKTLVKAEQEEIVKKMEFAKISQKSGFDLANEIYGKEIFTMKSENEMWDAIIDPVGSDLGEGIKLSGTIPPHLYGGRTVGEFDKNSISAQMRTRYLHENLLITGDIIAMDSELYLFASDKLFDLNNKNMVDISILQNILACERFAVIRPSMVM